MLNYGGDALLKAIVSCEIGSATSGLHKDWKLKNSLGREHFSFLPSMIFLGMKRGAFPFLKANIGRFYNHHCVFSEVQGH